MLSYEFVDGFAERRAPLRDAHLHLLHEANARGLLLMSGPLGDPPDGALLICRAESAAVVEELVRTDPYVTGGLVTAWRVRPWKLVIGAERTAPPQAL
jgi:uncharacterized protein YciI